MDDQKLMKLVQDNDEFAYRRLFDKYKKPIMNYTVGFVKDQITAEELTHEVFLKVYKNRFKYNDEFKFSTWLWTIARNTSYDFLKKKKEVLLEDRPSGIESNQSQSDQVESGEDSVEVKLIERAKAELLESCMSLLRPKQREALNLRIYSELSYDEIAVILESSESGVKSIIHRAKKALIDLVNKHQVSEGGIDE